jgi:hypothetical protein
MISKAFAPDSLLQRDLLPLSRMVNARAGGHEWGYVEPSEAAW